MFLSCKSGMHGAVCLYPGPLEEPETPAQTCALLVDPELPQEVVVLSVMGASGGKNDTALSKESSRGMIILKTSVIIVLV
jgi:hypothetical protein